MPVYRDKKRGRFVFEFDRYLEGQRVRTRKVLPRTWTQAQADAFDRQESAKLYAIATRVQRAEHSIEDAVGCYLKHRVPELKQGRNAAAELALMFWAYQGRPLTALADVCKAYALKATAQNGEKLSAASIRNRIRYLTAACRYAWKHHNMGDADPATKVIAPAVNNARHVYIDRKQMLALCRACTNRRARMAIRIAFYSGMRLDEIRRARIVGQAWVLDDTKNGNPRIVPIHPRAAVCARNFTSGPKITIQSNFNKARALVDLQHVHFHDLRHSAASALINQGVDLYTVGQVLGHKDSRSTQRYSHLSTASLALAIGKIGKRA